MAGLLLTDKNNKTFPPGWVSEREKIWNDNKHLLIESNKSENIFIEFMTDYMLGNFFLFPIKCKYVHFRL